MGSRDHAFSHDEIAFGAFCIYEEEARKGKYSGQDAHWFMAIEHLKRLRGEEPTMSNEKTQNEPGSEQPVAPASRSVFVLPYLRLSSGKYKVKEVHIGPTELWPDEDEVWRDVVTATRPPWLDIYRAFPPSEGEEAPPARGSILIAENDDWFKAPGYVDNAIAVLYVLGQPEDKWQTPAEAFFHLEFKAQAQYYDLVSIPTKTHIHLETAESLQLLPSLELRGVNRPYRVPANSPEGTELLYRFSENPDDRLVVGCYHLFRAQVADRFSSPLRQDYSAYCACLEALLEIDGTQQEIAQTMIRKLCGLYPDAPGLDRWVKGLYCERSVFNHGASDKVRPPGWEDWFKARDEFRARAPGNNLALLKRVCLDVLHDSLREAAKAREVERDLELSRLMNPTRGLVRGFFTSDALWTELKEHFAQEKAGKEILGFTGEKLVKFIELCARFLSHHRWRYMLVFPARARLINALQSCAIVIVNHPDATAEDKEDAKLLGEATDGGNDEISRWSLVHRQWKQSYTSAESSLSYLKAVAAHIAGLFETKGFVEKLA
jgi:hypothetical protein